MKQLQEFFSYQLYQQGDYILKVQDITIAVLILLIWVVLFQFAVRKWLPRFYESESKTVNEAKKKQVGRLVLSFFVLLGLTGIVGALGLNFQLYPPTSETTAEGGYALFVNTILQALAVLQFARIADWLISNIIIKNYQKQRKTNWYDTPPTAVKKKPKKKVEQKAGALIQSIVYAFALYFLIRLFNIDEAVPELNIGKEEKQITITLSNIILVGIIFLAARFFVWVVTQLALTNYYQAKGINIGNQFAINQLIRYIVFSLAVIVALNSFGLQLTVVWGAIAALLVGVGLGLQQTFNDWASGIILLLERTVEVGDIVKVEEGTIGTVRKIGLRVSRIETLDNISILVPNSMLVNDKVVNWSHFDNKARFVIKVGVAYGSDTQLVKKILLEVASNNNYVMKYPDPFVRFTDFGSSSLDFELHIWSQAFRHIEDIKSDIRFEIDQQFRANDVEIPFPQMDVWFKNKLEQENKKDAQD
ncbi:MAG: mechanosensitive ion channel domain-containing protein [Bacteroidota bacterium]